MDQDIKKKIQSTKKLQELEEKIYSRQKDKKTEPRERSLLHDKPNIVDREWEHEEIKERPKRRNLMEMSAFRKIFFVSMAFFVVTASIVVFSFLRGANSVSQNNIDILVLGSAFVDGGQELPLQIKIANRNNVTLEFVDLILEYTRGSGEGSEVVRERTTVGTIPSGRVVEENVEIVLFGQQGVTRDVFVTLEYRVPDSNAIFAKEEVYTVNISSAPLDLIVEGPENITTNQEFTLNLSTKLNSTEVAEDMMIVARYPSGFQFISAIPSPTFKDNIWVLGDLAPGSENFIEVKGRITAQDGEQRIISFASGGQDVENEKVIAIQYNSAAHTTIVDRPFISTEFFVKKAGNVFAIDRDEDVGIVVEYENTLNVEVVNVEISLDLSGNAYNKNSVSTNDGFFNSDNNTIVFNGNTIRDLKSLDPGESGSFSFSLEPRAQSVNPFVEIVLSAQGIIPSQSQDIEFIEGLNEATLKVISDAQILGKVLHQSGSILNSGPVPPEVGSETTYTIVWSIANPANILDDGKVVAELPTYVDWLGEVFPSDESIRFNSLTREVTWDIGAIPPLTSGGVSREVSFKVGLRPSLSQVDKRPELVRVSEFTAYDSFTDVEIMRKIADMDTNLFADSIQIDGDSGDVVDPESTE